MSDMGWSYDLIGYFQVTQGESFNWDLDNWDDSVWGW